MGLLDDAIKQHLELKRKHGAPEEEVQRQEEEALGPVRREAAPQPENVEMEAVPAGEAEALPADETSPDDPGEPAATGGQPFDGEASAEQPAPPAADDAFPATDPSAEERSAVGDAAPREDPLATDWDEHFPEDPEFYEATAPAEEPVLREDPEAPDEAAGPRDTPARGFEPVEEETPPSRDLGGTQEYDPFADDELEEPDEPNLSAEEERGDVLEDTPDFLQETPEHDRLWFEQKPPRDFDFE